MGFDTLMLLKQKQNCNSFNEKVDEDGYILEVDYKVEEARNILRDQNVFALCTSRIPS